MCLKFFIFCGVALAFAAATPQWYKAKNGNNYLIEAESKYTWSDADYECRRRGLKLAAIQDSETNAAFDALLRSIFNTSPGLWLGATDHDSSGGKGRPFYWSLTGKLVTFTNWSPGQPDNARGQEHCVHIYSSSDFKWNDVPCRWEQGYVCEGRFFE